ncbi:haloacid dehalogenase [Streptomyces sp. CB00316]|uniref:HAD family hydrolase n=1 Tax=Streptomyces sp. CB00316 TaxID=1703932 RepID=UPI00093EABE8|nr:HAD-IA family hydrolase [Streptomyces sp. CB00316]OKJ20871.1 haloacid dehalogenase [Streptomyces sp. CB00316]
MASESLTATVAATRGVLFDFDGPVCDVFAGHPAPGVARELAAILAQIDTTTGERALETDDPMEVLRLAPRAGENAVRRIEEALTAAEVSAVKAAGIPVTGAVDSLRAAHRSGRRVAIVSNNSAACVREFLALHDLDRFVHQVIGRSPNRPDLMKPSPFSLEKAARELGVRASTCTLIGDSTTDIEAAARAGSMAIGFANKPGKEASLVAAGARTIITGMDAVAAALLMPPVAR